MRRISVVVVLLLCLAVIPAFSQDAKPSPASTSQKATPPPPNSPRIEHPYAPKEANAPDMVCFGYYPRWSVQFVSGEARYVGYNEPDRYFDGEFSWVADENAWEWRSPANPRPDGNYGLSATIEKTSCQDPIQKTTVPYSAEVYMPEGTMVSGCCRKLKPGEAVIGKRGAPPAAVSTTPTPAATRTPAPAANNAPQAGHPVDQY